MAGQRVKCRTDPEGSNGRVSDGRRAAVAAQTVEAAVAGKHTRRGGAQRVSLWRGGNSTTPMPSWHPHPDTSLIKAHKKAKWSAPSGAASVFES